MAKTYKAVSVVKRGDLSKSHVYHPDSVPVEVKRDQSELVNVVLIERNRMPLSEFKDENQLTPKPAGDKK